MLVKLYAPYLGPEGCTCRPTHAVRYTCSGNLGIVKILRSIRSDMYTAFATNSRQEDAPPPALANGDLCLNTPKHSGKSDIYLLVDPTTASLNTFEGTKGVIRS